MNIFFMMVFIVSIGKVKEAINARIELNNSIVEKGCDENIQHDLTVENTALEFVLMLIEDE